MADQSVAFGTAFRRLDGAYFEVRELFHDGWVAGDLLFAGAELFPQDWIELGPDDLAQMTNIPDDEWRAKVRACAVTYGILCFDLC